MNMNDLHKKLMKDKKFLKALRGLCPDGVHCTSIEISMGGRAGEDRGPSATLTKDTRDKIDRAIKSLDDQEQP